VLEHIYDILIQMHAGMWPEFDYDLERSE